MQDKPTIVIVGTGQIGRAIAHYFVHENFSAKIVLIDTSYLRAQKCYLELRPLLKNTAVVVKAHTDLEQCIQSSSLVLAAIPWPAHALLFELISKYNKPLVSVSRPAYEELATLRRAFRGLTQPVILGCGIEPGLTEMLALKAAQMFDHVEEMHIKCGGITTKCPNNVFKYKCLFGDHYLPAAMKPAYAVQNGKLITVARFSDVERVNIAGYKQLEAWHDGMVPWLYKHKEFARVKTITQKTLRWPGFAHAVNSLHHYNLLSDEAIKINDAFISPKQFMEHLFAKQLRLGNEDNNTLLLILARGIVARSKKTLLLSLCAFNRPDLKLHSMAIATGFTAAIVAELILMRYISQTGLVYPEDVLRNEALDLLLAKLAAYSVSFEIAEKSREYNDASI
jgi:lysine 6-dehydrogenase